MDRPGLIAVAFAGLLAAGGCASAEPALTPEAAREALRGLVGEPPEGNVELGVERETLDLPGRKDGPSRVSFGPWRCDLAGRTFVLSLISGPLFLEKSGVFVCDADGNWRAVVTSARQN